MPSFRDRSDHQEAVSRRLAQLGAELAAQHDDPAEPRDLGHPVPVPGRHAAHRGGRWGLGPAHLLVVAVLAAVGLGLTAWWAVRGQPQVVDAPPPPAPVGTLAAGTPVAETSAAVASPSVGGSVTVDVAGKVRRPGIVVLDEGARVVDAVTAAGGARRGVDLSSVNLARVLVDGEQIVVGAPGSPSGPSPPDPSGAGGGGTLVNINTASPTELEALPEVGPVTAQAIVTWREEHGGFSSVDELLEVDGIGDATLAQITPHVTV